MNKGGIGVGSASIVLVFAVLCLTVFSLITYVVASNDKALVEAEARLVKGYYEADALAELVVAEILDSDVIPLSLHGINIEAEWDMWLDADVVEFTCPVSERKALYVRLAVRQDSYDVLVWRMYDTDEWNFDDRINVWPGPPGIDIDEDMDFWSGLDLWSDDEFD